MSVIGKLGKTDTLFTNQIKDLLKIPKVADVIKKEFNNYPPNLTDYNTVAEDKTCARIYHALKTGRFAPFQDVLLHPPSPNLVNESNLFATWIYEGRKNQNVDETPKEPQRLPDPYTDKPQNLLKFEHIRPLFTDCDDFNMRNLQNDSDPEKAVKAIPLHPTNDEQFKKFVDKRDLILYAVKGKAMPKNGEPWTDEEINFFCAWIYDGAEQGDKDKSFAETISYMKPTFPDDVELKQVKLTVDGKTYNNIEIYDLKPPSTADSLSYDEHIKLMFADGHREAMMNYKHFDLQNYDDVNNKKVLILLRLTRMESNDPSNVKLMPHGNPWPQKNILLFYHWAIQGPNSRNDSDSGRPQKYDNNDPDYQNMQNYYKEYLKYIRDGYRKVTYNFYSQGQGQGQ
ncbi:19948_t:CDS:1 [Racocetra persica]|uniref:19948_t:CDS:1 n=1 Tax=Racocetra persica TaxID=160502 RepID=A0ACA9K8I5_9GLOM|nr:19948_t:CDS:1 [Racocetra persica]